MVSGTLRLGIIAALVAISIVPLPSTSVAVETGVKLFPKKDDAPQPLGEAPESLRLLAIEGAIDRATYRLGPGDRINVTLSGPVQQSEAMPVTAEGTLIVPPAQGIRVAGLTVDEAQQVVDEAMKKYYRGVSVRLDVVNVRQFEVYVLGMVSRIGTYLVDGSTRVSTVVNDAGGVLSNASLRKIQLVRADDSRLEVDLLKFLLLGDRSANPLLQDGDRVVVPIAGEKAGVRGQVGRPDDYEVVEGENLIDLIELAGGTTPGGDRSRVSLRRFRSESDEVTDALTIDLDRDGEETMALPGDQIFVYAIPEWHLRRVVEVRGEVVYPGLYVINEGQETLRDVIERAGGFTPESSLRAATLTRSVAADTLDREFERLKLMDVADMSDDEYEYFKLRSRERPGRVVVDFGKLFIENDEREDLLLQRGDRIDVPKVTRSVIVSGQVGSPGAIAYEENRPIKWYVEQAGGYGWRAAKGETRVIRARTGEWISAKKVDALEVGDTIWIPEKEERDWWQLFRDVLFVTGQVATIYLVVDGIVDE